MKKFREKVPIGGLQGEGDSYVPRSPEALLSLFLSLYPQSLYPQSLQHGIHGRGRFQEIKA